MAKSSSHLLVVAIDFGTTYSGYAFSFRDDPSKVQTNACWNSGTEKLISLKTPTCVLLKPNKEFHSFGFEAENKYSDLAEEGQHHGWLYFSRFKMLLHNNEHLSRGTTVEDINGVFMPAKTIFAMSISYMRKHFLDALEKQMTGIEENDIRYVLTVPAIWEGCAKQFMREAAVEAGIDGKHLKLALEPEAASIWCQTLTTDAKALTKAGTQYMVIDLGGGTADITVHEKQIDNRLRELHNATGGPWGGTAVDKNYLQWLTKLFGESTMKRFKEEQMEDYMYLLRDFETKKRTISSKSDGKITFRVSSTLKEIFCDVEKMSLDDKISALKLQNRMTFTGDKMRIDASIMKTWFDNPIDHLTGHAKRILAEPKMHKVNTILLVGGFAESQLVQDKIRDAFQGKRIIIPNESGIVVLQGATRFGHIPDTISSRIMPFTCGMGVHQTYDKERHQPSMVCIKKRKVLVENVFKTFVRVGEEVRFGQKITKYNFVPVGHLASGINVYRSPVSDPKFVTDKDCKLLGTMSVKHPGDEDLKEKAFDVTFMFGDTEMLVHAKMVKTGKEFEAYINYL